MNKRLLPFAALLSVSFSVAAHAAPGEYWEVTTRMEMKGMPFAMPPTSQKVCIGKGGEKDPRQSSSDKDCEMTDVKTSGNKTSWKVRCNHDGEVTTGSGEQTTSADSYQGSMRMSGKTREGPMDMTLNYSGKKTGGACDTEEMTRKAQAIEKEAKGQIDKMCDTSGYDAYKWVSSSHLFVESKPLCPGKKEALCQAVRNDVPHDVRAFELLMQQEQARTTASVAKACNADIEGMKKKLCKENARRGPLSFLDANCPAEAKAYRELARKREECAGRGYTSGEKMKACMGGTLVEEEAAGTAKDVKAEAEKTENKAPSITGNPTADSVLEGAKKLKGLFKF